MSKKLIALIMTLLVISTLSPLAYAAEEKLITEVITIASVTPGVFETAPATLKFEDIEFLPFRALQLNSDSEFAFAKQGKWQDTTKSKKLVVKDGTILVTLNKETQEISVTLNNDGAKARTIEAGLSYKTYTLSKEEYFIEDALKAVLNDIATEFEITPPIAQFTNSSTGQTFIVPVELETVNFNDRFELAGGGDDAAIAALASEDTAPLEIVSVSNMSYADTDLFIIVPPGTGLIQRFGEEMYFLNNLSDKEQRFPVMAGALFSFVTYAEESFDENPAQDYASATLALANHYAWQEATGWYEKLPESVLELKTVNCPTYSKEGMINLRFNVLEP